MWKKLAGKLFPPGREEVNARLQAQCEEAIAFAEQGLHKQALDAFSALLVESESSDWKVNRAAFIMPQIVKLSEHYGPARFKARALRDERERAMREDKYDYHVVHEWCALTELMEPERLITFYMELKKKQADPRILQDIRYRYLTKFVENQLYDDFTPEDLDFWSDRLDDDAYDVEHARERVRAGASKGDGDLPEPFNVPIAQQTDEPVDEEITLEYAIEELQRTAPVIFELCLARGNAAQIQDAYEVITQALPSIQIFLSLVLAAQRVGNDEEATRILQDAKQRLSQDEFESLCKQRVTHRAAPEET